MVVEFEVSDKRALEDITCVKCNKLLNVAPIFCVESNQCVDSVCGRCIDLLGGNSEEIKWRQHAYEKLARCITYPCSNKIFGCDAILQWDEVEAHENVCQFEAINCPLFHKKILPGDQICSWRGHVTALEEHVRNYHKDCILTSPRYHWTNSKQDAIFFTSIGGQFFTVLIKCFINKSKYFLILMLNGSVVDSQRFHYQLEFFDKKNIRSVTSRQNQVESIHNILKNTQDIDKLLEIDISAIKTVLKSTTDIYYSLEITSKQAQDENESISANSQSQANKLILYDETLLRELTCIECNELMIPPIYISNEGYSICGKCRHKKTTYSATNITLEKLTTKLYYSCRNRKMGCNFVTRAEEIRNHEKFCELSEHRCLLTCGWKGLRRNMYNHFTQSHSIKQVATIYYFKIEVSNISRNVLYVNGEYFVVDIDVMVTSNDYKSLQLKSCKFNVQHLGTTKDQPLFRYQLQIIDKSHLGLNMSFTNICNEIGERNANVIKISSELLTPFICDNRFIFYKINIQKI